MSEQAGPVTSSERMASVDVRRGFALLGILTMNILSLGLPGTARLNPNVAGGFSGINYLAWLVGYFWFDEKLITIFSMLFGAGLVLMTDRSNQQGRSSAALYYRRVGILLVIGLIHAYLIWDGDILVSYALCGMIVYRNFFAYSNRIPALANGQKRCKSNEKRLLEQIQQAFCLEAGGIEPPS